MGIIQNGRKAGGYRRIQFYSKLVHQLSHFYGFVPFEYKIGKGEPDKIIHFQQVGIFRHFPLILAFIVDLFVLYWYVEAFFGQVTKLESYLVLAMNPAWFAINTAQWFYVFKFNRFGGLNLTNFIVDLQFYAPQRPSLAYELIYICCTAGPTVCALVPYPFLLFMSWHFPGAFHMLNSVADILAASLFGNSDMASLAFRHAFYIVIALALIDAVIRQAVLIQWLFCFLCAMNKYLEMGLKSFTNSTIEDKQIADSGSWILRNPNPSSFLRIKVLYAAYHQIFDIVFASYSSTFVIALIFTIFLLLSPSETPSMVTFTLILATALFSIASSLLFNQVTQSHISIQKLIVVNRLKYKRQSSSYEYKFWMSMKPPVSSIFGLCTFETKEFLLFIWANVVMNGVINLLLAF